MKGSLGSGSTNPSERLDNAVAASKAAPAPVATPTAPQPAPAPQAPPQQQAPASPGPEPKFFKDQPDRKASPEQVSAEVKATEAKRLMKIKAAGKEHEIDLADEAKVKQLLELGLGARPAFSDRDRLSKELAKERETRVGLERYKAAIEKIEAASGDDEALFRLITGGRDLREVSKKYRELEDWKARATPDELDKYNLEQRLAKMESEKTSEQARVKSEAEKAQKAQQAVEQMKFEAERSALKQQIDGEMAKVSSGDPDLDEAIYTRAHRVLSAQWAAVEQKLATTPEGTADWLRLRQLVDSGIPKTMIERAFTSAAATYNGKIASKVVETVKKVDEATAKTAKENAQLASTQNYGGQSTLEDEISKYAGRPTDLWTKGLFRSQSKK